MVSMSFDENWITFTLRYVVDFKRWRRTKLEHYKEQISIDYNIKVGDPAEAILQIALEENIELIVMGMTGKTDALDTLFGNTSQEVLAKSDCPVLAIPTKAEFKGIDNLVYATNFEFRDLGTINCLKQWSKHSNLN